MIFSSLVKLTEAVSHEKVHNSSTNTTDLVVNGLVWMTRDQTTGLYTSNLDLSYPFSPIPTWSIFNSGCIYFSTEISWILYDYLYHRNLFSSVTYCTFKNGKLRKKFITELRDRMSHAYLQKSLVTYWMAQAVFEAQPICDSEEDKKFISSLFVQEVGGNWVFVPTGSAIKVYTKEIQKEYHLIRDVSGKKIETPYETLFDDVYINLKDSAAIYNHPTKRENAAFVICSPESVDEVGRSPQGIGEL
jgi:hypothetical protein